MSEDAPPPTVSIQPVAMTLDQAASYWSVSPRKFREFIASGIVTPRKFGPRCVRYLRGELDAAAANMPTGKGTRPGAE